MDNRFEPLAIGEVLSVDESVQFLIGHRTFRVDEIAEAIRIQLEYGISGWSEAKNAWFSEEGIPCEVLRFTASGWQKGRVRINLEFCPQDFEDGEENTSASLDQEILTPTPAPASSGNELDLDLELGEPSLVRQELNVAAPSPGSVTELDLEVAEPLLATADEVILVMPPASAMDELNLDVEEAPTVIEEGLEQSAPATEAEPEFELEIPNLGDLEPEQEAPSVIYTETIIETSTFGTENGLDPAQSLTSLDDEFDLGAISESIEQELELGEPTVASDDELLDLGEMDLGSEEIDFGEIPSDDDIDFGKTPVDSSIADLDDIDFGETSATSEDDFEFGDFSLNSESEDNGTDSLLDDVWQDMNQASWQNNQ